MWIKYLVSVLAIWPFVMWAQKPSISRVVNAASYGTASYPTGTSWFDGVHVQYLDERSIATIFGTNLASAPADARGASLPRQLAGTSVSVNGVAAPLFYVSPSQINFQLPSNGDTTPGVSAENGL